MSTVTARKPRYFYGWNVVAASFLAQVSYAEHHSSMLGLFFKPLQGEFVWSRSAIAAAQTIARVIEFQTAATTIKVVLPMPPGVLPEH